MSATTLAITAVATQALGSAMQGLNSYKQNKLQQQQEEYNAGVAKANATKKYMEQAQEEARVAEEGRRDIASSMNAMSASGNIGGSAQTAYFEGAKGIDKDLSALRYKYQNTANEYNRQAQLHKFNAKVSKDNATSALIGGLLGTAGTTFASGYSTGLFKKA